VRLRTLLGLAALGASAVAVASGRADRIDAVVRVRSAALRSPGRDAVVRVATDVGSLYGVGVVAGGLTVLGAGARGAAVARAGLAAWTAAQAAKPLLPRTRPYERAEAERLVVEPAGTSWPSGHAAVAGAMADVLARGRGPLTGLVLAAAAVGVGASRVYVGVHHLSDAVAGLGLGVVSARALEALGAGVRPR
jgi:membrane-associated phospholipid phosphatase